MVKTTFKRYEAKYKIKQIKQKAFLAAISEYIEPAKFRKYMVQNLYYDTEDWEVIRQSIEKPLYKEKMRLRYYGNKPYNKRTGEDTSLFLEMKKKYMGEVYKRRIEIPVEKLYGKDIRDVVADEPSQISQELAFYLQTNPVSEKLYISYQREAYTGVKEKDLRITFDTEVQYRLEELSFQSTLKGRSPLSPETVILEIKTQEGIPLWLTNALSEYKIFPVTFSKCGICYLVEQVQGSLISYTNYAEGVFRCEAGDLL